MAKVKFATQISAQVLEDLKEYASQSKLKISDIVDAALKSHLKLDRVGPAFRSAANRVIQRHAETLSRLAK